MEGRRLQAHSSMGNDRVASSSDVPRKQQRAGEEEAVDADVTDLITQVHLKLSAQLEARLRDLGSSTYLHSVPTKRERHRERATWWKSSQRWKVQTHTSGSSKRCCNPPRGSKKTESGELSLPDQEKAEASRTLRIDHRRKSSTSGTRG